MLDDWYHDTVFSLWQNIPLNAPQPAVNGLINGTNVFDCSQSTDPNCIGGGKRFLTGFKQRKKYLVRFINMATDTFFKISLDNHTMTVISADFVPIQPYQTDVVSIGIGQRYEVIIEANQPVDNYWLRATAQTSCSAANPNAANIKGIVRYSGAANTDPTTSGPTQASSCDDESKDKLVPVVALDVPRTDLGVSQQANVTVAVANNRLFWQLNGVSGKVDLGNPTLLQAYNGQTPPESYHVLEVDGRNPWYYIVIQTNFPVSHPIHLHGHDFYLIAQGTGTFNASTVNATWTNPPRRDVAMLPAAGHLVIAFETDNPGIWLLHCHIAWHVSGGFLLQFLERKDDLLRRFNPAGAWNDTCAGWNSYVASDIDPPQLDSGLRKKSYGSF